MSLLIGNKKEFIMKKVLWIIPVLIVGSVIMASANLDQQKLYKEAFPDSKPKCVTCHVDAIPKKDDGKHELNPYGKEIIKQAEKPTVDTYKAVGAAETFPTK
jgi:hypothetical protein